MIPEEIHQAVARASGIVRLGDHCCENEAFLARAVVNLAGELERFKDAFTSNEAEIAKQQPKLPEDLFVADDAHGQMGLWAGRESDDKPRPVISKRVFDRAHPALWPALLRGLAVEQQPESVSPDELMYAVSTHPFTQNGVRYQVPPDRVFDVLAALRAAGYAITRKASA